MNEILIDNCFSGNSTEEKVLVAEHEDDGDHRGCRGRHPPDHHHLRNKRVIIRRHCECITSTQSV